MGRVPKEQTDVKVYIFWESQKILQNLPCIFDRYYIRQIYGGDFAKQLWPSQNTWTLPVIQIMNGADKTCKYSKNVMCSSLSNIKKINIFIRQLELGNICLLIQ